MLKCAGKIIEIIINILMFFIIIAIFFCLYNIYQVKVLKNDYFNLFGYSLFQVATGSMSGTIEIDDVVVVRIDDEYAIGDVVTYKSGKDFITHRVIRIDDNYIITKGDTNNTNDNPIDKGLIVGRVVKILRDVGVWKNVLLTPKVIISIFITLFCFSLLFSYKGKKFKLVIVNDDKNFEDEKPKDNVSELKKAIIKEKRGIINLENTVKLNLNDINKGSRKKILESTQIIDIKMINESIERKKKLECTQILDLNKK